MSAAETSGAHEEAPPLLRIQLLGAFRVWLGAAALPDAAWQRGRVASLLKLLALARGHELGRNELTGRLWPDRPAAAAANNLRVTAHTLRATLQRASPAPSSRGWLVSDQHGLRLDGPVWTDVADFERAAQAGTDADAVQRAIALYTGDLLPEDPYADWAAGRRETLRQQYLALLVKLARLAEQHDNRAAAIAALERLVTAEPAREREQRWLMRLYVQGGQRLLALRHYEQLVAILHQELGVAPQAVTRRLYEAILAGEMPPARAAPDLAELAPPARRGTLPVLATSLVGRRAELAHLTELLTSARLLTLTGPGGVGKTCLALEAARRVADDYPGGIWLVDLARTQGQAVRDTVAAALGRPSQPGAATLPSLVAALGPERSLLILDTCARVIEACAALAEELLWSLPALCILATSREPLRASGERVWQAPPLAPYEHSDANAFHPTPDDALALFVAQARSALPGFQLSETEAARVTELCRQFEGLPLGIELLAALVTERPGEELPGQIEALWTRLVTANPETTPRHRSLRASFEWDEALLSEPERTLLYRLGADDGPWSLAQIEVVCSGGVIEVAAVLGLLTRLVDLSLVRVTTDRDDERRYRLPPLVRYFAKTRLGEIGEAELLRGRCQAWHAALTQEHTGQA